jgi:topoisomerase-4 subunit A
MLLVSILGIAVVREYESFALLKKGKGKALIKLEKKDKLKYIQPFNLETQEVVLSAGKRFIRIDKKNIETYLTDKSSGGGVALPQGFRKITKVETEDN